MQRLLTLLLISLTAFSCAKWEDFDINNEQVTSMIKAGSDTINVNAHFPDQDVRKYLHTEFQEFYQNRDYKLAWLTFDGPRAEADELLEAIDEAEFDGLNQDNYNLALIAEVMSKVYDIETAEKMRKAWRKRKLKGKKFKEKFVEYDSAKFRTLAKLDFMLTSAYLTYGSHLLAGRIDPNEDEEWFAERRVSDLSQQLSEALESGDIAGSLNALRPQHAQYGALREAMKEYIEIKENGGLPSLSEPVAKGDSNEQVAVLNKALSIVLKDYNKPDKMVFDDATETALKKYQYKHSLPQTGKIDDETLTKLNRPVDYWMDQIALTMEKLRWVKNDFKGKYVLVNVPAFQMEVINNNKVDFQMKVIVGKTFNPTPIFSDTMEYIVFRPTWTVPRSIMTKEMLPAIKRNPGYLPARNYQLYTSWDEDAQPIDPYSVTWDSVTVDNWKYRIVETPGARNSLGLVKFIFPNSNNVYLHDTPADYLFSRADRNFSHGCIRVEKPAEFAQYLLGWDMTRIQESMYEGDSKTILLDKKLPVHIVYWTAWVDHNGELMLLDDLYSRDSPTLEKLHEEEERISQSAPLGADNSSRTTKS